MGLAAFGIGEAAENLEVVIVPSGFPFGGLVFRHGEKSQKEELRRKKFLWLRKGADDDGVLRP
jgi:hypothetical protein